MNKFLSHATLCAFLCLTLPSKSADVSLPAPTTIPAKDHLLNVDTQRTNNLKKVFYYGCFAGSSTVVFTSVTPLLWAPLFWAPLTYALFFYGINRGATAYSRTNRFVENQDEIKTYYTRVIIKNRKNKDEIFYQKSFDSSDVNAIINQTTAYVAQTCEGKKELKVAVYCQIQTIKNELITLRRPIALFWKTPAPRKAKTRLRPFVNPQSVKGPFTSEQILEHRLEKKFIVYPTHTFAKCLGLTFLFFTLPLIQFLF